MLRRSDGTLKPRLFAVISGQPKPEPQKLTEPVMLALLAAHALQKADLARAVLELRETPSDWVNFLVQLDSLLLESIATH